MDVRKLEAIGTEVMLDERKLEALTDEVRSSIDAVEIGALRQRAYGLLLKLDRLGRERRWLPAEAGALLWWTDNDEDDASSGLNWMTAADAARLASRSVPNAVRRIVRHYEACRGQDDGHPAYEIFRILNTEAEAA